ncbi:MAG: ABC transporter substrate-binding protein, partial [Candidatus Nanopelagicales bacterium]
MMRRVMAGGFLAASVLASAVPVALAAPADPISSAAAGAPVPRADALVLGTLLPDTGALADYGPATQAAVALAVADANDAGGVDGSRVTLLRGDSGDSLSTLVATLTRLRAQGASAVIGPLSSSLLLDSLTSLEGLTVISPATTSPLLSGLVARIAPSDALQGAALVKLAAQSRVSRLVIVAPRSSAAIAQYARTQAVSLGMPATVVGYADNARASDIADDAARVHADGLLLVTGAETTSVVRELVRRGLPGTVLLTAAAGASVDPAALPRGTLRGARVTAPDLRVPRALADRVRSLAPKARQLAYAAQAYDAAAVAILAAEQSSRFLGEVTPPGIRAAIPSVTTGGTPCDSLATCLRQARAGTDIGYVGLSGPVDLGEGGDPTVAAYAVRIIGPSNAPGTRVRYV